MRGDISVAIDGVVTENDPTTAIGEDAEIHLVPAIAGGRRGRELQPWSGRCTPEAASVADYL